MNHIPAFDVITQNTRGEDFKLGRAWLKNKDGKYTLSFDLSSLPFGGAAVQLVIEEDWDEDACPKVFSLKMPVDKGEHKKTYWHPIGRIASRLGDAKRPFDVLFDTIPIVGSLIAFEVRPQQSNQNELPFG